MRIHAILMFVFLGAGIILLATSALSDPFQPLKPQKIWKSPAPFHCCTQGFLGAPDSKCFLSTSIESCRDMGGAVQECGTFTSPQQAPSYNIKNVTQYPPNWSNVNIEEDPILANLTEAIRQAGIFKNKYNVSTYNCVNFSSDLEIALTALGFNATVTIISWGHAVTDVHIGPYTIFIEPQINASIVGDPQNYTYLIPYGSLDYERQNDSKIGVLVAPNPYPNKTIKTENGYMISIYDNWTQAQAAGVKQGK